MIDLVVYPKPFDFIGNGIKLRIQTDNHETAQALTAIAEFTYVSDFVEPQRWGFYNPDTHSIDYIYAPSSVSPMTTEQKMTNIRIRCQSYLFFVKHYKISQDYETLTVETRKPYHFYWPDFTSTPAALNRNVIRSGVDGEYRTGFKIKIVVLQEIPEDKLITEIEMESDKDGFVEFGLAQLLKPYIKTFKPGLPTYASAKFEWPQFRLYIYESFVDNGDEIILDYNIDTIRALNGKIDHEKYPGFDLAELSRDKNFWMNSDYFNEVWIGQEFFLYFFSWLDKYLFKLVSRVYCEDLTIAEWGDFYSDNRNSEKRYVHFFSGHGILADLDQYFGNRGIYKVEMWIENESTHEVLSHVRTFKIIEKPQHTRQFAFLNKFGLLETFGAIGKSDYKFINKKEISKRELKAGYSVGDKEYVERKIHSHNEIEMTTGSLTKEQALEFQQVLDTDEFYEIVDDQYLPCIIDDGSFKIIPESDDLVSIKFSYRRAFDK